MSKTKKGFTVRKRKDCNRFELLIHPVRKLGLKQFYGGLFNSQEEAEESGKEAVNLNVPIKEVNAV